MRAYVGLEGLADKTKLFELESIELQSFYMRRETLELLVRDLDVPEPFAEIVATNRMESILRFQTHIGQSEAPNHPRSLREIANTKRLLSRTNAPRIYTSHRKVLSLRPGIECLLE